jgi:hypothetical protein
MLKKYVFIPRRFLVINVCNQGKILCSSCISTLYNNWQKNCINIEKRLKVNNFHKRSLEYAERRTASIVILHWFKLLMLIILDDWWLTEIVGSADIKWSKVINFLVLLSLKMSLYSVSLHISTATENYILRLVLKFLLKNPFFWNMSLRHWMGGLSTFKETQFFTKWHSVVSKKNKILKFTAMYVSKSANVFLYIEKILKSNEGSTSVSCTTEFTADRCQLIYCKSKIPMPNKP